MAPILIAVGCECLLITSCLFGIKKTLNRRPKNHLGFILLFSSIALAALLGIINYASLHPLLASYHPIVSHIVTTFVLPLLLPFAVYQALDCGPIRISESIGQMVLGLLVGAIGYLIVKPNLISAQLKLSEEIVVIGSVVLCVVFSLYGLLISNQSRYRCKNMLFCVGTMFLADTILSKNLLGALGVNTHPFGSVDIFHIVFSLAMYFLSIVSSGTASL